ncbi:MAG: nucleotide sugar dehydrogenase [Candidatus Magasanikbacteria bacterium]|nr:nucleotide sugar dehydrogenase [Candidatus Magasanikbacteria bacterium]
MAEVCILGTGYVGLVTGVGLAHLGHQVVCVDIDEKKIDTLSAGRLPFYEDGLLELVQNGIYNGRLSFTTSLSKGLRKADYVFVAVATPPKESGEPDLSQLFSAVEEIAELSNGQLVVIIKSTVPVGCFKELGTILSQEELTLVCCPEFLAEGAAVQDFFHPSRTIVGADDEKVARQVVALFDGVTGPRIYCDIETAQLIKYASNSFLASRIAFINELSRMCEYFGVDVRNVESGILLDPRFGNTYLQSGIGFAGPCLPKDLAALVHTAKTVGHDAIVCKAIEAQNQQQLDHAVKQICSLVETGDKIAVFGISFKAGTSDVRNSFSVEIIKRLEARGYNVVASDPVANDYAADYLKQLGIQVMENPWSTARGSAAQIFLTGWPQYRALDMNRLFKVVKSPRIFDGPGIFDQKVVEEIGFQYLGIGRVGTSRRLVIVEKKNKFTEMAVGGVKRVKYFVV